LIIGITRSQFAFIERVGSATTATNLVRIFKLVTFSPGTLEWLFGKQAVDSGSCHEVPPGDGYSNSNISLVRVVANKKADCDWLDGIFQNRINFN
jgi:hypothetical protein